MKALGLTRQTAAYFRRVALLPPVVGTGRWAYYRRADVLAQISACIASSRDHLSGLSRAFRKVQKL